MNAEFLRTRLMELLQRHPGRKNAVPRDRLLADLKCYDPKLDDRRFRDLYAGLPVCTCPDGLFIPKEPEEVRDFKDYITKGWGPILADRRVKVIMAYYPQLAESTMKQGELQF